MSRALLLILGLTVALAGCGAAKGPAASTNEVFSLFRTAIPDTPLAAAWDGAREHVARLLPQDVTEPRLVQPGVDTIRVRALHSRERIVFRLQWADATKDEAVAPTRFSDAVAVQLPVVAGGEVPDAFMGARGRPVHIHLWKAVYQAGKRGPAVIKALYPNAAVDHYPFSAAAPEKRAALEAQYAPAARLGNPVASTVTSGPTQDLEAEGYGTLTPLPRTESAGQGAWQKGTWSVVLGVPLPREAGRALAVGQRTYVAFAVWNGTAREVGAKKMRSNWVSLVLEGAR